MHVMDQRERTASCVKGCLLGGAVGDALGAPVACLSLADMRRRFGPGGISDYVEAYGRVGAITQLTLFTAEGLVRAYVRARLKGICHPPSVVQHAYLRWLVTQGVRPRAEVASGDDWPDGWLIADGRLWARRAPANTCLTTLAAAVKLGERAQNDSTGCGAIMRVAPVGLLVGPGNADSGWPAFDLGVETALLTHGHPSGYLAAGYFAEVIAQLVAGRSLRTAIDTARTPLEVYHYADEVLLALDRAVRLAEHGGEPTPAKVESLGVGRLAEESVAIAVYTALMAESFEHGVRFAVNHSGDSDSTASLTGHLLGTSLGHEVIPARWLADLELRDVTERMADDLVAVRNETFDAEKEWSRFPGW